MEGIAVVFVIFAVLVLLVLYKGVVIVPQGYNYTVERFGRFTRVLTPGMHIIIPFFDRISNRVNMMEQVLEIPAQEAITKDNALVRVDGVAYFQVVEPGLAWPPTRSTAWNTPWKRWS